MTGDAPVTDTVSASEPGLRVLTLPSRTVLDNVGFNAPDVGGAAASAVMAGAAVGGGGVTLRPFSAGSAARGTALTAGAAAAEALLPAGAVGDDTANGSTFAIRAVREKDNGWSRTTAMIATPRTATGAVQAQRGRHQTETADA